MGLAEAIARQKPKRLGGIDSFLERGGPKAEEMREFLTNPSYNASELARAIAEEYPGLVGFSETQIRRWRRANGIG